MLRSSPRFENFSSISKPIRFLKPLGEKEWKELVSDLKTFAHERCKIAAPNCFLFLANFALQVRFFFAIGATICIGQEMLYLPYAGLFLMCALKITFPFKTLY